jgi:hypothetical protein
MAKIKKKWELDRRTFLKCGLGGASVLMGLPLLEAMVKPAHAATGPLRFGCLYTPNGVHSPTWWPTGTGANFSLAGSGLEGLEDLKSHLSVYKGMSAPLRSGRLGLHAAACARALTCQDPVDPAKLVNGPSLDQLIARSALGNTKIRSLQLAGASGKWTDREYASGMGQYLSWAGPTPLENETNPSALLATLFQGTNPALSLERAQALKAMDKSILDYVLEDKNAIQAKLGQADKQRLEQYFQSVFELERRIIVDEGTMQACQKPSSPANVFDANALELHWKVLLDILVVALQCDLTRSFTFLYATEETTSFYNNLGVGVEFHGGVSHYAGGSIRVANFKKIQRHHADVCGYFVRKLKNTPEGTGNILDNSVIMYGAGLGDGNSHTSDNIPQTILGLGGGKIRGNYLHALPAKTPTGNLQLAIANSVFGLGLAKHGNSTGMVNLKPA